MKAEKKRQLIGRPGLCVALILLVSMAALWPQQTLAVGSLINRALTTLLVFGEVENKPDAGSAEEQNRSPSTIAVAEAGEPDSAKGRPVPIQRAGDAPQPLSPEESAAKIVLPDGFRIELVASEPVIEEPSCVAFDPRGRMFVCELHGYNVEGEIDVAELNKTGKLDRKVRRIRWELQGGPIAEAAAKRQYGVLKMLTDTDGDGLMDKAEVWADDLPACYGVLPARDGVIVTCAPDIVYLGDKDGDGRVDVRETLFSGFKMRVMERGINNPIWGLDDWIYVGAGSQGGRITGPNLAQPVDMPHSDFRIKADGSAIEAVNGRVGTFGLTQNSNGDRFPSSGGRPAMYALPLPQRYLTRNSYVATPQTNHFAAPYNRGFRISQPHPWRVRRRRDPAWIKFYGDHETNSNYFSGGCSNTFYGDALFPEQYLGNLFYCEPSLNMVHRCVLTRAEGGYRGERAPSEKQSEFLASTDQWFRPMNLRVGPEGALYIVDMYREIIEDYSAIPRFLQQQYGLDKGRRHGRLWRLLPQDAQGASDWNMSQLSGEELVKVVDSTNAWRRMTAHRLLLKQGDGDHLQGLAILLRENGSAASCVHALHILKTTQRLQPADVLAALQHSDYSVRVHALRMAEPWIDSDKSIRDAVLAAADDSDSSVRIQVAMTLGESSLPEVAPALAELARRRGKDRWMSAAIMSSCNEHSPALLSLLLTSPEKMENAGPLLRPLSATLAGQRNVKAMSDVLTAIGGLSESIQVECLLGFNDVVSRVKDRFPASDDGWAGAARLLTAESESVRDLATQLSSKLPMANQEEMNRIFAAAIDKLALESASAEEKQRAIRVLANAPANRLMEAAAPLLDASQPVSLQLTAIESLSSSSSPQVGSMLLKNWPSFTPAVRKTVLQKIFDRDNRRPAILDAIEDDVLSTSDLTASQMEQLLTGTDEAIVSRAKRVLANPEAAAEFQDRIAVYQAALKNVRNLENGEKVFRNTCITCHVLDKEGFEVGPALGTIINKPDEALLLDLLDPSSRIVPDYRSYMVITNDGRTFAGILASESATSVTLRKEKGLTEDILRRDIDILEASEVSLMPSDLHKVISPQDAADLLAFLRKAYSAGSAAKDED